MPDLLDLIPDLPRWVWARHLALRGAYEVFGLTAGPAPSAVLRGDGSVFVIGRPSDAAVLDAVSDPDVDLVAPGEAATWLSELLPHWTGETAPLYRPGGEWRLPPDDGSVRITDLATIERHVTDPELLSELRDANQETEIAARFVGERPVAFCYASAVTETLWDVAIDTVEDARRQGHAERVTAFMIRRMAARGLATVWCALESNPASWKLAEKLGLVRHDAIVAFERD